MPPAVTAVLLYLSWFSLALAVPALAPLGVLQHRTAVAVGRMLYTSLAADVILPRRDVVVGRGCNHDHASHCYNRENCCSHGYYL